MQGFYTSVNKYCMDFHQQYYLGQNPTFILMRGKDKNGNWYLLGKGTTGLPQNLSLFNSWKRTKSYTYTHPYSKISELLPSLFFLLLCPYSLTKANFHMPISHPHMVEKMSDFLIPQKQWPLFMPTWCDVSTAKMKRGKPWSKRKKDHLQKEGLCLFNTAHECYQRLGNSMQNYT